MTIEMVVWVLAVGGVLTGAAWAFARVARRLGWQERWIWFAALVFAAGASWIPTIPKTVHPAGIVLEFRAVEVPAATAWTAALAATEVPAFGAAWAALAALVLGVVLLLEVGHRRRRVRMPRARIWGYPVRLDERDGPAVSGLVRPTVVLQRRALDLAGVKRRALVTHELEHVRAGDVRVIALAYLAVALTPWNPWSWILARRVAMAVEADCDRRTLRRRRISPGAYATLLLEVAAWRTRRPSPALQLAMGRDARRLMSRLDLVLQQPGARRPLPALALLAVLATVSPALADPPRVAPPLADPPRVAPNAVAEYSAAEPGSGVLGELSTPTADSVPEMTASPTITTRGRGGGG